MKGKVVWSFWLLALLAVITATASYAWLAISTEANVRGFEVELVSDSVYLEISDKADRDFGKEVYFNKTLYRSDETTHDMFLVSYGVIPDTGAFLIYPTQIISDNASSFGADGKYNGGEGRFYLPSESVIGEGRYNFIDVTETLTDGQSLIGYYVITEDAVSHTHAQDGDSLYYVASEREGGARDYSCIGKFTVGEKLSGRMYWGKSSSTEESESQPKNVINVISMDYPTDKYCLKKTVFIRSAKGTVDAEKFSISAVEIDGRHHALSDAIRIMFVVTSDRGHSVTEFYSHREPEAFNGELFNSILGDRRELVTVDMYIFFDGRDVGAHTTNDDLTSHTVTVKFDVNGLTEDK